MGARQQRWLSTAQRFRIGSLLHAALIEIRMAARESDLNPVRVVAAALRDLPVDMWRPDCDLETARAALARPPAPQRSDTMHKLWKPYLSEALAGIAAITPAPGAGASFNPPVVIEVASASGEWHTFARCTNSPHTIGILLESASRPWPRRLQTEDGAREDPFARRLVRAIDTRLGREVTGTRRPITEGRPDWTFTGELTNAQRVEVCRLVGTAFDDIHRAAEWEQPDAVHELADLAHNLPRDMWWSRFYLLVESARDLQDRFPTIGGVPTTDYASRMVDILAMREEEVPGDAIDFEWVYRPPHTIE